MSSRFVPPFYDVGSGLNPSSGAQLFFFETGTSKLKDTFSDQLSTPTKNKNPVDANAKGVFPNIFITGSYKVVLKDKKGSQEWTADPVEEFVTGSGQLANVLSRDTLNDAVIDDSLQDGLSIDIKERVTNNDGGAIWDVVLASTVTPNTFNVVICTGVPTLALVLRDKPCASAAEYGFLEGDVDNSAVLVFILENNSAVDLGGKTYKIKTKADITLTQDTLISTCGGGLLTDVANGSLGDNISINCNGFSFETDNLNVSGGGVSGFPFYVFDNQESTGKVTINGGSFNDSFVNSGNSGNSGCFIRGGFEEVNVSHAEFRNHSRALGNGNPGVTSTSGLSIRQLNTFDVKTVNVSACSFTDVTNGETSDNANNTDADGLLVFANVASNLVRRTTANIANCSFTNCKGRAIKTQNDVTTVTSPIIYRNIAGITGASVEIDLQIHGGDIISPTFLYEDSTSGEATFIRPISPMSIFAAGTLKKPRISNVSAVTINDNTTSGTMGTSLITATQSDLTSSFDSVINVNGIISTASHASFMSCPALTGTGKFFASVDSVYIKEIDVLNGVFGFASSANLKDKAIIKVDKFTHSGTEVKPTFQTTLPASLAKPTLHMNAAFGVAATAENGVASANNNLSGVDETGARSSNTGLHVYSMSMNDDEEIAIQIPNGDNKGIVHIHTSLSRLSAGVVSIDSSGALNFGAGAAANFNPGGTTNNDIDGDLNIWSTGGELLIKNRLGSTRTVTINFQG